VYYAARRRQLHGSFDAACHIWQRRHHHHPPHDTYLLTYLSDDVEVSCIAGVSFKDNIHNASAGLAVVEVAKPI